MLEIFFCSACIESQLSVFIKLIEIIPKNESQQIIMIVMNKKIRIHWNELFYECHVKYVILRRKEKSLRIILVEKKKRIYLRIRIQVYIICTHTHTHT